MFLHDFGTESRFSFVILILQTTWFTAYLHDLGTKSRFSFGILILQKAGWNTCLQRLLIHDAKLILEILLFGSWSSKLPGLQQICMILGQNPDSIFGSWSSKHLQTTLFTVYLHDLGTKSRFSFWILILQTSCFTAYLHDLGTKSRFSFRILILQKGWNKCIQMSTKTSNPRCKIKFGNLTFRTLTLQTTTGFECFCMILGLTPNSVLGSLSSKPPCLQCICMILGLNLDSALLSLSSKLPGLQRICMILGLNLDSVFGSWSFKKTGWNTCIQMSTTASNPRCKITFGNLTFRTLILQTT